MKILKIITISFLLIFITSILKAEDVVNKKFTDKEITKMAQTKAVIETKVGNIEITFFPEVAPNHVNNFIELAKKGIYNGTTFHRVIPNFMIQGGDPLTKDKSKDRSLHGTGGPGYTVKAEFNNKPHKRGTLSMARAQNPDSAGSQFFICVADSPFLDGQYTVFGQVSDSSLLVIDKIVNAQRDVRDNPLERIEMQVKIIE
jgi:peptidyl-prolyl cis-trans isomerase B (cyclophilin B)